MAWTNPKTWSVGELVTAANLNTHVRDNELALGRDVYGIRNVGTAGGLGERWYAAGLLTSAGELGFAGSSLAIGQLHAVPLFSPRGGTLDRIAFNVMTAGGAGSVARAGIYQATSDTNLYPNALVVDGGEFTTTTVGVKAATVSVALSPAVLFWAVLLSGVAAPSVSFSGDGSVAGHVLGMTSTFTNPAAYITHTQTYGALPATFPTGALGFVGTAYPIVGIRYSA